MPYIFGMILRDVLGRIGVFRRVGATLLLGGVGFLAYRLVAANLYPAWLTRLFADYRYAVQKPEAAVAHTDRLTIAKPAKRKRLKLA